MTRNLKSDLIRAHVGEPGKAGPVLVHATGNRPPAGARIRQIAAEDGALLRAAFWTEGNKRGSVLLFPGRTEFVEMYFETVGEVRTMGLAAGVFDWRNQGLNERALPDTRKGNIHRFADYQKDAEAFWKAAETEGLPRPWILLAHSMGGAIAYSHAALSGNPPDGLILLAPMFGLMLGGANSRASETIAEIAVRLGFGESYVPGVDRRTVMERGFDRNPLTSDERKFDLVRNLHAANPALALGGPTWRWMREALCATRRLRRQTPPGLPILALLADNDRVVDNRKTVDLLRRAGNAKIQMLDDCLHCPLLERHAIRRKVFDTIRTLADRTGCVAANH